MAAAPRALTVAAAHTTGPGGEVRIEAGTDDTRLPALVACVDTSLWIPMWILVWIPMWIHLWRPRDDATSDDDEPQRRAATSGDDGDGDDDGGDSGEERRGRI